MTALGASEIVNVVVAILFAISEVLPFIRNTEANGVIDFVRILCVYVSIKLSRAFGMEHPADQNDARQENSLPSQSNVKDQFAMTFNEY